MSSNDKIELKEIKQIQSITSSTSTNVDHFRRPIDPSAEIAETHLLLEENSFPHNAILVKKDDNSKRIDIFNKEDEQPQNSPLASFKQKSIPTVKKINKQPFSKETTASKPRSRRTVTFKYYDKTSTQPVSKPSIHESDKKSSLSNQDPISTDLNTPNLQTTTVDSNEVNYTIEDLNNILSEDEYIPGGFANLDAELEEELLNDFTDELDLRPKRRISSDHVPVQIPTISRSPIELWQRARILIAIHLYQIENRALDSHHDNQLDPSMVQTTDNKNLSNNIKEFDYLEKLFKQKENLEERKIIIGLIITQTFSLDFSHQYQCVDFYDVEQGYIMMCNVRNVNTSEEQNQSNDNKLVIYPINKNRSNEIHSVEFDCSYQFDFMICIPIYRIILAFVNIKSDKSLMILIGDASRKGVFLSKQEISHRIYSILYIHESSMLFLGCMGRILLYNTQPLQNISQPLFISELNQFPFQSAMEPIIHLCQMKQHQSIGILSNRYFLLWEYTPKQNCLMKFCNPYQYDFIRCHYNQKYDYIIFAFIDGLILIYHLNQMKQIRRYKYHWKMITDLKFSQNENYLLSSSMDQIIHIWNLETLQHVYQYDTNKEIFQIDIIEENLFYYRTMKNLILFKLNLPTLLFSITKTKVLALKLCTDRYRTQRIIALLDDYSSLLLSPVTGSHLTSIPNISKKPIKQILHDISRSHIYSLEYDGEIIIYNTQNNPCIAQYKIHTKSEQYTITCMTLVNLTHTHLVNIQSFENSIEKSLEKQAIFFGHANGYISLFQDDSFIMEPKLAHKNSIVCLETSQISMEKSNISFTNCEVLLSSSTDKSIYLWNLIFNETNQSIELIHLLTIEQEKNLSKQAIQYLSMIDNFIVANYSDQNFLHIWQLLNISVKINDNDAKWGVVEHPTKGKHHRSEIQGICATPKLKIFASLDTEGCIKLWDNTNTLLREIYLDKTVCTIEFNSFNGELIIGYQNNIHLLLPETYLFNLKNFQNKQKIIPNIIAEDKQLDIVQSFYLSYETLPIFTYNIKTHHSKKRLQRFEQQLAGRYAVIESDSSQSDAEKLPSSNSDNLSIISDDPNWSNLTEDVKDILRMKKSELRQNKYT